jgi:hypothetical protein
MLCPGDRKPAVVDTVTVVSAASKMRGIARSDFAVVNLWRPTMARAQIPEISAHKSGF